VKRWSKQVPGKDIFNLNKVFFPINVARMHWVCAVAFIQEKKIQFYDSFGSPGTEYLDHIFRYLQEEHQDKKKCPLPDIDQWKLVECTRDTPTQGNGQLLCFLALLYCTRRVSPLGISHIPLLQGSIVEYLRVCLQTLLQRIALCSSARSTWITVANELPSRSCLVRPSNRGWHFLVVAPSLAPQLLDDRRKDMFSWGSLSGNTMQFTSSCDM